MSKKLSTAISVFSDLILVNLAVALAVLIRFGGDIPWQNFKSYLLLSPFITPISPIIFYVFELYDRKACTSRPRIVLNASRSSLVIFIASILLAYFFRTTHLGTIPTPVFMLSVVLTITLIAGWRIIRWYFQIKVKGNDINQKLVILGANQSKSPSFSGLINQSEAVHEVTAERSEQNNTQVIRFSETAQATNTETDDRKAKPSVNEVNSSEPVTEFSKLCSFIEKEEIQEVFVESEVLSHDTLVQLAYNLANKDVQLSVIPDQYEVLIGAKITTQGSSFPTIQLATDDKAGWYMNFKRVADVFVSLGILAGMLLLYPIIAALIKLTSKGPVFYNNQERVGLHGRIFKIWKFRSMYQDAEKDTGPVFAKENDHRMTPIGRIMRKIRFDELPNFINVLKGDMSFIGPRPERPEHINNLKAQFPFYIGRLQVRPGITGWAQVNGNYDDIEFKIHYDQYYIENMSPLLDFIIFLKTIPTVLFGKGAR